MRILGVHDGHNASAALYEDGRIIAAVQEERLRYEKNWTGFPSQAVAWIQEYCDIDPGKIDYLVFNGHHMPRDMNRQELIENHKLRWSLPVRSKALLKNTIVGGVYTNQRKKERIAQAVASGFAKKKMRFIDHHHCHASAAYYGWGKYDEEVLVLTCDGAGDRICASVNIGKGGRIERIASIHENESIASLYACITTLMGFVPLEHEYKLMGMAPYAESKYAEEVASLFREEFVFNASDRYVWQRSDKCPPPYFSYWYWRDKLEGKRFDAIMGGLQMFVEQFISKWVRHCIQATGIRKLALGGGFFMNVKANKVIMDMEEIDDLFVFPSCGDEMNAIGSCFALAAEISDGKEVFPLENIYWGPEYSDDKIALVLDGYMCRGDLIVEYYGDDIHYEVAKMLASGGVVARFFGREEFGARSLGNRAILADPKNPGVIVRINKMIKKRDFWMPFACSMKSEALDNYLVNPKKIPAPYMILTFDTTKAGRSELYAGTHPQDGTVRPQEVVKESNPEYWTLIDHFEQLTGRGGVLNTSFNLHGYPIVHTPEQALDVLLESGLEYLQLGGYLVRKV